MINYLNDLIRQNNTYWLLRPQAAMSLGFGVRSCACKDVRKVFYGFSALYEGQIYWKQNMLYKFIDQTNGAMIAPIQGDLFIHGLTINGFIDF